MSTLEGTLKNGKDYLNACEAYDPKKYIRKMGIIYEILDSSDTSIKSVDQLKSWVNECWGIEVPLSRVTQSDLKILCNFMHDGIIEFTEMSSITEEMIDSLKRIHPDSKKTLSFQKITQKNTDTNSLRNLIKDLDPEEYEISFPNREFEDKDADFFRKLREKGRATGITLGKERDKILEILEETHQKYTGWIKIPSLENPIDDPIHAAYFEIEKIPNPESERNQFKEFCVNLRNTSHGLDTLVIPRKGKKTCIRLDLRGRKDREEKEFFQYYLKAIGEKIDLS